VRILHKPTGVVVSSQSGRSQHANREEAMSVLGSKLYEAMKEQKAAEVGALRKEQIGTSDRSEKIRTYNFPDDRITDHRLNIKAHNIQRILEGDLDYLLGKAKK
jgi:peptide chain release factor 1